MTPDERRARLNEIIDAHNAAASELRHQSFDATLVHLRHLLEALQESHAATDRAVAAMMTANSAALALLNQDET